MQRRRKGHATFIGKAPGASCPNLLRSLRRRATSDPGPRIEGAAMPIHDWTEWMLGSSIISISAGSLPLRTFSMSACCHWNTTHLPSSKGQASSPTF